MLHRFALAAFVGLTPASVADHPRLLVCAPDVTGSSTAAQAKLAIGALGATGDNNAITFAH